MSKSSLKLFPLLLVVYEIAAYLSSDMYLPALPAVMQDLQISHHLAQLTLTLWFFGSASMQLILGPLSDRFGRRPVLLLGGVLFLLTTLVCAVTRNIPLLLLARFVQGSTVCSVSVAGYAAIHELFEHQQALKTLAWMNSVTILAPALGPLSGGLMLSWRHDWRLIFWLLAVMALIALTGLFRFMPESQPAEQRHPLALALLAKNYRLIIANAQFSLRVLTGCLLFAVMILWITASPFLIIQQFHYSAAAFGIIQAFVFSGFIIGTRLISLLVNRLGAARIIQIGLTITCMSSLLSILLTLALPFSLYGFIATFMLFSLGVGMLGSPLQRLAVEACAQPNGIKMAVISTSFGLFGVFGSLLAGLVYQQPLYQLAVLMAAMALLARAVYSLLWLFKSRAID